MIAIDTNLLVYAHRGRVPEHAAARAALERAFAQPQGWGIASPCISEFWCVVTHPSCSGRPSRPDEAIAFIESLVAEGNGEIWLPGRDFGTRLMQLGSRLDVVGPRIFDLQIGLIAFENGASELWTHDRNFVGLPGLRIVDPLVP